MMRATLALFVVCLSANAFAEAPGTLDSSGSVLEEVVVTTQRRSENLQDVPIAVSSLSGAVLDQNGLDAQVTLPRVTPGLSLNMGAGFSVPYIRGIGTVFATLGLESSVATYFDDQYISRPMSGFFSFSDIERIEVLKGPQGTLYGRNAAAGAIRIITKDPVDDFEARASVTYGRFDQQMADGVLNLRLAPTLTARFAGSYERRDSYIDSIDADHGPSKKEGTVLRTKLLWEPTDDLAAKLTLDYGRVRDPEAVSFILIDQSGPASIGLVRGGSVSRDFYTTTTAYGPGTSDPDNVTKTWGAQLRVDYRLPSATLSSISGYRWTDMDEHGDQDATQIPYSHFVFIESGKAYFQEFQAVFDQIGRFKGVGGLYYYLEKGHNDYESFGQTINDAFGLPYGPSIGTLDDNPVFALLGRAETEAFAPYLEGTVQLTERVDMTLGARYTWEEKTMVNNDNVVRGLGPEFSVFSEEDKKFKFRQFTPKASVSYRPSSDVLLYLTYSRGFKSGGFSLPSATPARAVDAEDLDSYELGYKMEMGSLRLNGSAFYYELNGLQVQRPNDVGGVVLENAANAHIYGTDLDALWAATDRVQLGFGVSYLKAEYKDYLGTANVPAFATAACDAAGGAAQPFPPACIGYVNSPANFSGKQMINAPEVTAYGRLQYRQPLADGKGQLLLNGLLSYTDEYFYNPEQSLREPSKFLLSSSVGWSSEHDRFTVTLSADNLLDEKYDIYKTIIVPVGSYRLPGSPRTWSIRLGTSF